MGVAWLLRSWRAGAKKAVDVAWLGKHFGDPATRFQNNQHAARSSCRAVAMLTLQHMLRNVMLT